MKKKLIFSFIFLAISTGCVLVYSFSFQDLFNYKKENSIKNSIQNLQNAKQKLLDSLKIKTNDETINFIQEKLAIVVPAAIDAHVTILETLNRIDENTQNRANQYDKRQALENIEQKQKNKQNLNLNDLWKNIKDVFGQKSESNID